MKKRFVTIFGALLLVFALLCSCDALPGGGEEATSVLTDTEQLTEQITELITGQGTQDQTEPPAQTTEPATDPETGGTTEPETEETTEPSVSEPESTQEETTETPSEPPEDPYVNMSAAEFYSDYEPADDYWDSYWRTQHGFMSGSIEPQDQAPTIAEYQPMEDGKFVRNTYAYFSSDGNTYYIVNGYGQVVNQVFRCGAYARSL